MLVVSDTSPLTALIQIGCADLLPSLFGRVVIPAAVERELLRAHPLLPNWLEVRNPQSIPESLKTKRLDQGELAALALALELQADILLIDERLGRRAARELGLAVTGVLGLLVLAKERGHIAAVGPLIDELRARAGCWFHRALVADVLRACGE